jgi:hypothetical protein
LEAWTCIILPRICTLSSASGLDPLSVVWNALVKEECDPQGRENNFRSYCPVHRGDARSLSVGEGSDGRVLTTCHAHGCSYREIMNSLGLQESDGFPDGHKLASPARRWRPKVEATQAFLNSLNLAGITWARTRNDNFYWAQVCPACGAPRMWINRVDTRRYQLSCENGCESEDIKMAIDVRAVLVA